MVESLRCVSAVCVSMDSNLDERECMRVLIKFFAIETQKTTLRTLLLFDFCLVLGSHSQPLTLSTAATLFYHPRVCLCMCLFSKYNNDNHNFHITITNTFSLFLHSPQRNGKGCVCVCVF